MLRVIRIKPIQVITISHRLLMLKIPYINDLMVEHSITQITDVTILANIQLIFLITIIKTHNVKKMYYNFTNG